MESSIIIKCGIIVLLSINGWAQSQKPTTLGTGSGSGKFTLGANNSASGQFIIGFSNVTCAPPLYACAYTSNTVINTPSPLFSLTDAANTQKRESVLSQLHWTRLTDRTTGTNDSCPTSNAWTPSVSGGWNDVTTNINTTLVQMVCLGGKFYVVGYNPTTMQTFPTGTNLNLQSTCTGSAAFSRVNKLVWYCRPSKNFVTPIGTANGTTIYKVAFSLAASTNLCGTGTGTCPDPSTNPTWTVFFDYGSTCPIVPAGSPTWGSIMGVGLNDSSFTSSFSWTGNQGTGHLLFHYIPGTGCSTLDTNPNPGVATHPNYYPVGAGSPTVLSSLTAVFGIHDSQSNGAFDVPSIQNGTCTGSDCNGNAEVVWQANTTSIYSMGAVPNGTGGHNTLSASYYLHENNPSAHKHLLGSTSSDVLLGTISPAVIDSHISADYTNDVNPFVGSTDGLTTTTTLPYWNEVWGMATNCTVSVNCSGTIFRFAKTYKGDDTSNFYDNQSIGEVSQDRCTVFLTSSMQDSLGTFSGKAISDIFAIGICGQ